MKESPATPEASPPSAEGPGSPDPGASRAHAVVRPALVLAAFGMLAFVLALLWQLVLASRFGTSSELDAFWVGLALPKAVVDSFHIGILTVGFILIFNRPGERLPPEGEWRLANSFLNAVFLATLVGIPCLLLAAPLLVRFMAPGLELESQAMAARVLRLTSLMLVPTALTGAAAGILHARKVFLPFAAARVAGLSMQIVVLLFLGGVAGVFGIAWALLAGAAAMLIVILPRLWSAGFRYAPVLDFGVAGSKDITAVFVTFASFSFLDRVNQMSDRFFASFLGAGAVSAFEFGWRFEIPVSSILSLSVALPSLAIMASQAWLEDRTEIRETITTSLTLMVLLVIPTVGFLVVFREPLTILWFQRGAFSSVASEEVASLIPALAVSFSMRALGTITVFGLLAVRRLRAVVWILLLEVVANTALNALLVERWGLEGIVFATAATMVGSGVALAALLLRELDRWSPRDFASRLLRPSVASGISILLLAVARAAVGAARGERTLDGTASAVELAGFAIAYVAVHFAVARSLGVVEAGGLVARARMKLKPRAG